MRSNSRDWGRLDREALPWLEKVWKEEEKRRKGIERDWPVKGIGSSSKLLEEDRLGLEHRAKRPAKEFD